MSIRVTVWGENYHENNDESVQKIYPDGMHNAIKAGLEKKLGDKVEVRTAVMQDPENGLPQEVLDQTDVLTWWGHMGHHLVDDAVVERVYEAVLSGMGILVLHSAHFSKIFKKLMGTSCVLQWRGANDTELVWTVAPGHPITEGVPSPLKVPAQEMYGEYFDIPQPDEQVFISSFSGGEVFRSGCCWRRGRGRVFYFSPGDQEYPVYHQDEIQQVLANAVRWAAPTTPRSMPKVVNMPAPRFTTADIEKLNNQQWWQPNE